MDSGPGNPQRGGNTRSLTPSPNGDIKHGVCPQLASINAFDQSVFTAGLRRRPFNGAFLQ